MYKRLTDDKITDILETGIEEFAEHGLDRANINLIAKKSGVSVGVLYKYFQDKDTFFLECVRHSLKLLHQVLEEALRNETDMEGAMRKLVSALIRNGKEHGNYYAMYNEITSGSCKKYAGVLAEEIEQISAGVYTRLLENGKKQGIIRKDMNPCFFAFFFDNLLMMLQFSYSCQYYKERFRIYCGDGAGEDEVMIEEFVRFMKGAFGMHEMKEGMA